MPEQLRDGDDGKTRLHEERESTEMSWRMRCTVREPLVPPFSEELTLEAIEPMRTATTSTVLQRALAHLVHFHSVELVGTRFEFFERRDDLGHTMP